MLIRRETPADETAIHAVTQAAFAKPGEPEPAEADLVDWLRVDEGWIPALSMVAIIDDRVAGHVVCTRAWIAAPATEQGWVSESTALGLGPLSVHPDHQRRGVGPALMHAGLGAADALGESLIALLGSPDYYSRFGFRDAAELNITSPDPTWGRYFQARALTAYDGTQLGQFRYAEPFSRL